MVFKVYKKIKDRLDNFKYPSFGLISFITIKLLKRKINRKKQEIDSKIIDFIKYK